MHIELDVAGLQRAAPQLGDVGRDVDALGAGTLPAVAGAGAAVGDGDLAAAVAALVQGVGVAVQGAVLSLTELGRTLEAAGRDYAAREAEIGRTMRPGPQP